jgi:hypothetical protein
VRDTDGECPPGGGVNSAHHLVAQFEASRRNALLIVPELRFDPDEAVARENGARALLAETLTRLAPRIGKWGIEDVAPIVIAAHSAGNEPAAAILEHGGLDVVEIWHFDSLYDEVAVYVDWIRSDLPSFEGNPARHRFVDIYTHEWGTEDNSLNLAEAAANWFPVGQVLDDRTLGEISDTELHHGLVFKLSALSHDDVARIWFSRLLSTSGLPPQSIATPAGP